MVNADLSLDLSTYSPGVYSLVLRAEGTIRTQRIIKN